MLALCWLIFRSWASFFHSGTSLARLLGVFLLTVDFFFAFWVAPGRMFGHPGTISRVRNYFFWCFVVRAGLQCEKIAHVQKPHFFPVFLYGFYILRALSSSHKTTQNHSRVCPTELPAKIVLQFRLGVVSGRVWCSLGRHLTGFCSLLGGFWPLLGTSWASLGHFLDALGCLLAALWTFAAAFRLPGPSQASILKGLGTSQTEF